jgi:hypothetical protein
MASAPHLATQTINPLQSGWDAQVRANFAAFMNFAGRMPFPIRRVYFNSANQPTSGTDANPYSSLLRDFPPALYQGCLAWVLDSSSVTIGATPTDSGNAMKYVFSDGTSWFWMANPGLGALDAAT